MCWSEEGSKKKNRLTREREECVGIGWVLVSAQHVTKKKKEWRTTLKKLFESGVYPEDEGQVEWEKDDVQESCWFLMFWRINWNMTVLVRGCAVEEKRWMWWGMGGRMTETYLVVVVKVIS